jgi:hypothetical protein
VRHARTPEALLAHRSKAHGQPLIGSIAHGLSRSVALEFDTPAARKILHSNELKLDSPRCRLNPGDA